LDVDDIAGEDFGIGIALEQVGNPDLVAHGETGLLVPPDDVQALSAGVVALCRDAEARARMGRAGRRRCEERYDIASVSRRYERVYESLLGTGSATP